MSNLAKTFGICAAIVLMVMSDNAMAKEEALNYIKQVYLAADANYGEQPINHFKALGKVRISSKLQKESAPSVRDAIISKSSCEKCDLTFVKALETKEGGFILYRLVKPNASNAKNKNSAQDDFKVSEYFGFALLRENITLLPAIKFTTEDPETGGFDRELWDIFELDKTKYLLIFSRHYESHLFELYTVEQEELSKKLEFEFGGL
jgi:hypothetical protein